MDERQVAAGAWLRLPLEDESPPVLAAGDFVDAEESDDFADLPLGEGSDAAFVPDVDSVDSLASLFPSPFLLSFLLSSRLSLRLSLR